MSTGSHGRLAERHHQWHVGAGGDHQLVGRDVEGPRGAPPLRAPQARADRGRVENRLASGRADAEPGDRRVAPGEGRVGEQDPASRASAIFINTSGSSAGRTPPPPTSASDGSASAPNGNARPTIVTVSPGSMRASTYCRSELLSP